MRKSLRGVERWAGFVALVLGAVSTGFAVYTQAHAEDQVKCQSAINQEFLTILKERAAIGNENTANINNLIQEVFTPGITSEQAEKDYQNYLTELAKINGDLKHATYPEIGNC